MKNKVWLSIVFILFIGGFIYYYEFPLMFYDPYQWHCTMGTKHLLIANNEGALYHANRAMIINETNYKAHWIKAVVYYRNKRMLEAQTALDSVVIQRPDLSHALQGMIYLDYGTIDTALYYFNQSFHINPLNFNTAFLGIAYLLMDDLENGFYYLNLSLSDGIHKTQGEATLKSNTIAHLGMAHYFRSIGLEHLEQLHTKKAIEINPNANSLHKSLVDWGLT